jgi:hypothetical protein
MGKAAVPAARKVYMGVDNTVLIVGLSSRDFRPASHASPNPFLNIIIILATFQIITHN